MEKVTRSYETRIEDAILNATTPINVNETEEVNACGHRGVLVNKQEILNFNGPVPISQYRLNEDPNPEIIRKVSNQPIEYNQDISVRYLRPPAQALLGDIIIRQENHSIPVCAPPLIVRERPPRPLSPTEPIIIREEPPALPTTLGPKIITLKSKSAELPPRKVVIERLPQLPAKPQSIIIEKWLPFPKQRRRVVYEGSHSVSSQLQRIKNTIIQWESPPAVIKKGIRYLGIVDADPNEYRSRYGHTLKHSSELPSFIIDHENISRYTADAPVNYTRDLEVELSKLSGSNYHSYSTNGIAPSSNVVELFGDLEALKLLDRDTLEREGLSQYLRDRKSVV